ncbi:MAG: HPF/RaiA family ribosome-associated protein [Reyranellaceae bacterium]
MQIQVNTDANIQGREDVVRYVEKEVTSVLGRFGDQITRIEVHLSDANAAKAGARDKRCTIEARLAGRKPEAVSDQGETLRAAVGGATRKLKRYLDKTLGRRDERKGGASIRSMGED